MTTTPLTLEDAIAQVSAVLESLRAAEVAPRAPVLPNGLPGPVAAGELIEAAWGNAVVTSMTMVNDKRPYVRFQSTTNNAPPSTNNRLTLTPVGNVYDPNAMIGGSGITIPAGWPGIWHVSAAYAWGSNGSAAEADGWIEDATPVRFGTVRSIVHATKGTIAATSAVIPMAAGQQISFWCYHLNASATPVTVTVSATWVGRNPT